jgi:PAS domain S-box-containing protein
MATHSDDSIFVSLPYGLCIVDHQGRIVAINPALERLLGWQLPEMQGQTLSRCLEQEMADPAQALCWTVALSEALEQGQTTLLSLPTEIRTGFDDGHLVPITGVVAPCQGSDTAHPEALIIFHDSRSQKDSEGARARFLAVLAHELGTPVANLSAAADLLARRMETDDELLRRLLRVICSEATHLRRLLAQFPTAFSVRAEAPQTRRRLVTLRPVLRQVAQAFGVRNLDCQIAVQAPPDLPFVWSDTERIQQILSKLVDNAIRYAPPGSYVVLAAERRGDEIVISVQDRGPGIPQEREEHLFEPWHRCDQETLSTEHQGLGLAMAHTLVRSLGGRLWHESPPEGGASFCFSLPHAQDLLDEEGDEER